MEQRGWFDSSQDRFCRLHDIMVRTIVNNLQGKPTDTPVWEKNGWTGTPTSPARACAAILIYPKFLHDLGDAQDETGSVPQIAPTANWAMENTPVWNSIFILATKKLRDQFGLRGLMEEQYEGMRRLMELTLVQLDQNGGVWGDLQLADWVSPAGEAILGSGRRLRPARGAASAPPGTYSFPFAPWPTWPASLAAPGMPSAIVRRLTG